jgi:hypothetical protein
MTAARLCSWNGHIHHEALQARQGREAFLRVCDVGADHDKS